MNVAAAAILLGALTALPALAEAQSQPPSLARRNGAPLPKLAQATPPPVAAPQAEPGFYFMENGTAVGPLTLAEMELRIRDGHISRNTPVWKVGTPQQWKDASTIPELVNLFANNPPPVDLSHKFTEWFPGVWTVDIPRQELSMIERRTGRYTSDGQFVFEIAYINTAFGSAPPGNSVVHGNWSIQALDERRFSLILHPVAAFMSSTNYTVIDDDTIHNEQLNVTLRRVSR